MSKGNDVSKIALDPTGDMTKAEKEKLQEYKDSGLEGVGNVPEHEVFKMFELYMMGKSYSEIANAMKRKKEVVLYFSEKSKWLEAKHEHYSDLTRMLSLKVAEAKTEGVNFLVNMMRFWHKRYGTAMEEFIRSGDEKYAKKLQGLNINNYVRCIEALDKIMGGGSGDSDGAKKMATTLNLHLGGNDAHIEKVNENTYSVKNIRPKDLVAEIAQRKRQAARNDNKQHNDQESENEEK